MSPRSSKPISGGPYRKPRADIYTLMLALALVAIVIGCICLYLEVADYGPSPYQLTLSVPLTLDRSPATGWPSPLLAPTRLAHCPNLAIHG